MQQVQIEIDGLRLAATRSGAGRPVLLLHGIPGSAAVWTAVARELSADFQVVVPDLLGFGASARTDDFERLWIGGQAAALSSLVDELDLHDVIIAAHDYGGPVASALVSAAPGRFSALLLAASNVFPDTPIPFPLSGIFLPVVGRAWAAGLFSAPSLRMMVRNGVGRPRPPLRVDDYVGDAAQAAAIRLIFENALRELEPRYTPVSASLRACGLPSTVVWGDRDPFFPVQQAHRTAELLGGAPVTVLPDAGHFLPEERPAELAAAVRELAARSG